MALLEQHEKGAAGNHGLVRPSAAPAWQGLRALRVAAAADESASVRSLVLEPVDGERRSPTSFPVSSSP